MISLNSMPGASSSRRRSKRRLKTQSRGINKALESMVQSKLVLFLSCGVLLTFGIAIFTELPSEHKGNEIHRITNTSSSIHRWLWLQKRLPRLPRLWNRVSRPQTLTIHMQGSKGIHMPHKLRKAYEKQHTKPNYDKLDFEFLDNDNDIREIWDFTEGPGYHSMDKRKYYTMDDDYEQIKGFIEPSVIKKNHTCRYPERLKKQHYPTCNDMHELGMFSLFRAGETKHIGGGSYHEVFSVKTKREKFVFKEGPLDDNNFPYHLLEEYKFEALVSTATTPHPKYADFYGYCSASMIGELMDRGSLEDLVAEYDRCEKVFPLSQDAPLLVENNLTEFQKVQYSLDMAESIARLHNHPYGVIIHNDIQLSQFLVAEDGKSLKFNDFNRADFMMWDEESQRYCKYLNGVGAGDWRSPEEFFDKPLDEKIDIYSLGNNIYTVLTGFYVFPNICKYKNVRYTVKSGERSLLDKRWKERSYGEGELVEVIKKCWEQDPKDRPNIGEIVLELRSVLASLQNRTAS